jgi:hypothetical protein
MLLRSTRVLSAVALLSITTTAIALHANSAKPSPAPLAAAPQTSAECWTASLHDVPQAVRSKLAKLFPSGKLID